MGGWMDALCFTRQNLGGKFTKKDLDFSSLYPVINKFASYSTVLSDFPPLTFFYVQNASMNRMLVTAVDIVSRYLQNTGMARPWRMFAI